MTPTRVTGALALTVATAAGLASGGSALAATPAPAASHVLRAHAAGDVVLVPFTTVATRVYNRTDTVKAVAAITVANAGTETASVRGTVTYLGAGGAVLATDTDIDTVQTEIDPGQTGVVYDSANVAGVTAVTFTPTASGPRDTPAYRGLTATINPTPTVTGTGMNQSRAYAVSVVNTGPRTAHLVEVLGLVKDGTGTVDDVSLAFPDDIPAGATVQTTITRYGFQPDAAVPTVVPDALETLDSNTIVTGTYAPTVKNGTVSTTWTVSHFNSAAGPIAGATVRLVKFTATSPQVAVASGTTDAKGHVTLPLHLDASSTFSFLVDGGPTWAPARFSHLTLNADVTVKISKPSGTIKKNKKVTIKGTESPAFPGDHVYVERKSGKNWKSVGSAKVSPNGTWKLTTKFAAKGTYTLRVRADDTVKHFGTVSDKTITIKVK